MDMRLFFIVYFKIGFLNFSNICCWYTLELPWVCLRFVIVVFPYHTHYFCLIEAISMCTYNICQFNK